MRIAPLIALTLMPGVATAQGPSADEVAATATPEGPAPALRSSVGLTGAHGPLRVVAAHAPAPMAVGTGLTLEYVSKDDMIVEGDHDSRLVGTLALAAVVDDHVELFLTLRGRANENSTGVPELVQALGETSLGIKAFGPVHPAVGLGGLLQADLRSGQGKLGWQGDATSFKLAGLATLDARRFNPEAIVRAHLNLGYAFNNGSNLSDGRALSAVEQFGGNIVEFDTLDLGLAVEALPESVTPFIEWGLSVPLGTRIDTADVCVEGAPCPADEGLASYPHRLALGLAGEALPGLTLRGALELGLQTTIVSGLPATPPYNIVLGLAYDVGAPAAAPAAASPEPAPAAPGRVQGRVRGRVVDVETRQPLAAARIAYPGSDRNAQLAGDDGIFTSYDFDPGAVRIEVSADGYAPRAFQIPVTDSTVNFSFPLKPAEVIPGAPPGAGPAAKPAPPPPKPAAPAKPGVFDPLAPPGG